MPDIQQRIAELLYTHQEGATANLDTGNDECRCGEQGNLSWRAHFAEVLTSELGLTREHGVSCVQGVSGRNVNPVTLPEDYGPAWTRYSRYVTEWEPS